MRRLELHQEDIYKGDLILINRDYPIRSDESEVVATLRPIVNFTRHLASSHLAQALREIYEKLGCLDEIVPISCFRSHQEQDELYNSSILENGLDYTKKFVAKVDTSEHQSGLAVDLGKNVENIDFICPVLPYDGIYGDFRREALLKGFIERYKRDKEEITGISCEPWHFRYVGLPHSIIIEENNLCLEEYHRMLLKFTSSERPYIYRARDYYAKIFHLSYDTDIKAIQIEEDFEYNVSGNNIDGFIVTQYIPLEEG